MKAYRLAVLIKEFPFLSDLPLGYDLESINDIKIRRGDRSLLAKKGHEDSYSYCDGGHHDYTDFYAIWSDENDGHFLKLASSGHSATGSGDRQDWDADTIGEQLFSQKINPSYIVEFTKDDTDDNGNGELRLSMIIYKMNRFDLAAYHEQQIDQAASAIKAEIAAVCAA